MLTRRAAALFGLAVVVGIAVLMKNGDDTSANTTAVIDPQTVDSRLSPNHQAQQPTVSELAAKTPSQQASSAVAAAEPVYLESTGVVERLQKSRHDFFSPAVDGVPQRSTFRFTLERQPLAELASQQATVAWPVNDGGVEFVKLTTLREQDGNLFISGEVVDGQGQFVMVMTQDNSMSGHLLSPRGMYSYNSQLDEIVGQRVEGPVDFD